jgi:ATP synthase protein I
MGVNVTAEVGRVLCMQVAVLTAVFLGGLVGFGWQVAKAAGLGGMVALLPNAYLAMKISCSQGKSPEQIVRSLYWGEVGKLALTAGLFFLVLRLPEIRFIPLFVGFIAGLSALWLALFKT